MTRCLTLAAVAFFCNLGNAANDPLLQTLYTARTFESHTEAISALDKAIRSEQDPIYRRELELVRLSVMGNYVNLNRFVDLTKPPRRVPTDHEAESMRRRGARLADRLVASELPGTDEWAESQMRRSVFAKDDAEKAQILEIPEGYAWTMPEKAIWFRTGQVDAYLRLNNYRAALETACSTVEWLNDRRLCQHYRCCNKGQSNMLALQHLGQSACIYTVQSKLPKQEKLALLDRLVLIENGIVAPLAKGWRDRLLTPNPKPIDAPVIEDFADLR